VPAWLVPLKSRFLPDYIRLELDAFCTPILPVHHVTSLLERRPGSCRWTARLTRAVVMGKLWRITPSYLPKSWEVDEVKVRMGQKIAAYC
jgi:hypothetical protein